MNTTPIIKITKDGPEVGVATARLLLQHAIEKEQQSVSNEDPDLALKQSVNELTGASIFLPPTDPPIVESTDPPVKEVPQAAPSVAFQDNQP